MSRALNDKLRKIDIGPMPSQNPLSPPIRQVTADELEAAMAGATSVRESNGRWVIRFPELRAVEAQGMTQAEAKTNARILLKMHMERRVIV